MKHLLRKKIYCSVLVLLFLPLLSFAQKTGEVQDISVKAKPPMLSYVKFGGFTGGPINKADLFACDSFSLMPDYPMAKKYYWIKSFSMCLKTHSKPNKLINIKTNGHKLSTDMKTILHSEVAIEDMIIFYDFVIQGPNGEIKLNGPSFYIVAY